MKIFFLDDMRFLARGFSRMAIRSRGRFSCLVIAAAILPVCAPAGPGIPLPSDPLPGSGSSAAAITLPGSAPHVSSERSGVLPTSDGLTLRLTTDLGSVHIVPLETGAAPVVRYVVRIETDARAPLAKSLLDTYELKTRSSPSGVEISGTLPPQAAHGSGTGAQFWVHFDVTVPVGYHVDVKTGVGDIETQDIGGSAQLLTQGGNIVAGRIGFLDTRKANAGHAEAVLETEGGHIQVQEVTGDLTAFTAGGHIIAGNISGDASLRSGGGHIRAGKIGGRAELETEGGNITVNHADNFVNVRTGGGQIDFGEVRGSVRAQTAGGGIRIMYVSGPMNVESNGGSICLTRVASAVQAATTDGTITAWINPDSAPDAGSAVGPGLRAARSDATVRLAGASQLASRNGDIVVFLPRNLAVTIDALVASGDVHRIIADPAIHLALQAAEDHTAGSVHAIATLNGGGTPLKLRTTSGNISLQFLDSQIALRDALIHDELTRLNQESGEASLATADLKPGFYFRNDTEGRSLARMPETRELPQIPEVKSDWLRTMMDALEVAVTGGLHEDPKDFQKRLTRSPHPSYPALAQGAGIQGLVKLQVRVTKEGHVEVLKVLEGEPVLADAAASSVKQWQAKPGEVNGKPVDVYSMVTFNFQLP
ncbi:MAG: energy transducer TonB [Candidatus Acidiferrum sp.]